MTGMPSLQVLDNEQVICFQTSSRQMGDPCHLIHLGDFFVEKTPGTFLLSFRFDFVSCHWLFCPLRPKESIMKNQAVFVAGLLGRGYLHLPVRQLHKTSLQLPLLMRVYEPWNIFDLTKSETLCFVCFCKLTVTNYRKWLVLWFTV